MLFDLQKHSHIMANYWYAYTGPATPTVQFLFPSNYVKTSYPFECEIGNIPCVIYATGPSFVTPYPYSFSTRLQSYIANGTAQFTNQPTVAGKKFYFYVMHV